MVVVVAVIVVVVMAKICTSSSFRRGSYNSSNSSSKSSITINILSPIPGVRDPEWLVRAASLSALGDVCKELHFSLGPIVQEVSVFKCGTRHDKIIAGFLDSCLSYCVLF